ncbi:flagellar hook-length control protein FliK [Limnobacter litoralis]|uniref:Flagellar hook-length control protein-like C-terminal domain-containing protein n=1 Tax=Limnobacter litoralis TaxID=481366 RepID=A0ABQ5YSP4_9BURK|nr:flagellar hook-length control protein FliK [Limnobacter litoralis]GLR27665.1 hypothetical protein GCM10007875_27560 [Limnobacter litoralis]
MSLTPVKNNPPSLNSVLQSNPGDRVSASKGEVAPIVAVLSRQMPLPQAQQLAGQTVLAQVVKGGADGEAVLEYAGNNIPVKLPPGKMLTAGELITVNFALNEKKESGNTRETGSTRKTTDIRNLLVGESPEDNPDADSPSFVDKLSSSARLIGFLDRVTDRTTPLPANTLRSVEQLVETARNLRDGQTRDPANSAAQSNTAVSKADLGTLTRDISGPLAKQVSSAIENSGLFYESHLKEWANGQRTKEQLALEPQAKFDAQQVISEKNIDPNALNQSVRMVTTQLATLDQNRIALALNGLLERPVQVEIQPDDSPPERDDPAQAEGVRPWVARLKLDMAHLGELEVRVRMLGSRCDVSMKADPASKQALDAHWREFQDALNLKGLTLEHGQIMSRSNEAST